MIIYPGDRGDDVRELQRALNAVIGAGLAVDGINGVLTVNAAKDYQRLRGLVVDGLPGPVTLGRLYAEWNALSGIQPVDTNPPFPPMSSAKRAATFGRFDWVEAGGDNIRILGNWERDNIQKFYIPQLDGVPYYEPGGGLKCKGFVYLHKLAGPIFQRFFQRVEDTGLLDRIKCYDGAFVPRRVRGGSSLSNHAWGTAMDINAYANPYHHKPSPVGVEGSVIELVPLAHECGIYWGGNFSGNSVDGMHFEVAVVS